jgi:hypothetical protein
MISIKKGVQLAGVQPVMWRIAVVLEDLYAKYKSDLVITSGTDGKHGKNSLHPKGRALDFRTSNLPGGYQGLAAQDVSQRLKVIVAGRGYDIVLEEDHLHVEYDPKEPAKAA